MADASRRRAARQQLESLHRAGVRQLPRGKPKTASAPAAPAAAAPPTKVAPAATPARPSPAPAAPRRAPASSSADPAVAGLEVLRQEVAGCHLCGDLQGRTQTVFGVGDPHARLCFFGEAPGADEDAQGEPFVGRAGKLLDDIIRACKMKREEVYILNTLKCRPPGNRTPAPEEVANCRPFFERQLELIQPEFICCLGACAAQAMLQTTQSIGKLRGKFHDVNGVQVLCTYHPAYLLRNPEAKRPVWDDMKMLMRAMGRPVD